MLLFFLRILVFFTAGCLSFNAICYGTDSHALDKLLLLIEQQVATTKTVQGLFQQERHLSIFNKPVIFNGKLYLSRPDNLRWEIVSPIPSVMIFSGDKGLRCSGNVPPEHFNLRSDPVMRMVAEQLWTWADGAYSKLKKEYEISLTGSHKIELRPKDSRMLQAITAISVVFDKKTLQPQVVTILETGGDKMIIRFHDYRLDEPMNPLLFQQCFDDIALNTDRKALR